MNLDQTAPKGSSLLGAVWSGSILFAVYATKNISRREEQMTKVVTGGKRANEGFLMIVVQIHCELGMGPEQQNLINLLYV